MLVMILTFNRDPSITFVVSHLRSFATKVVGYTASHTWET
jgi:hypothetical protein